MANLLFTGALTILMPSRKKMHMATSRLLLLDSPVSLTQPVSSCNLLRAANIHHPCHTHHNPTVPMRCKPRCSPALQVNETVLGPRMVQKFEALHQHWVSKKTWLLLFRWCIPRAFTEDTSCCLSTDWIFPISPPNIIGHKGRWALSLPTSTIGPSFPMQQSSPVCAVNRLPTVPLNQHKPTLFQD